MRQFKDLREAQSTARGRTDRAAAGAAVAGERGTGAGASRAMGGPRNRRRRVLGLGLGLVVLLGPEGSDPSRSALAQIPSVFVNTTEDLPPFSEQCLPGKICPLRGAIERAETTPGGAIIRACYDPAETPGGKPCRGAALPLKHSDPGYDPESGKWFFEIAEGQIPYALTRGNTQLDFTLDIEGWSGPADNKIVLDASAAELDEALLIGSSNNVIKGIEFRGGYRQAAITLSGFGAPISGNQLGPGLIFAAIRPGVGVRMRDPDVSGNRLVGSWCGITGDGTEVLRNQEDCVQLSNGTHGNTIGGPTEADRNIFAASTVGVGVSLIGPVTADNVIEGNWFGMDAQGNPAGNEAGITIKEESHGNKIRGNLIGGNRQSGITLYNRSLGTEIRGNHIGERPDGGGCVGNANSAIEIVSHPSNSVIEENRIACNGRGGIVINGSGATRNRLSRNSITNNAGQAIRMSAGANGDLRAPSLDNVLPTRILGRACAGCLVEIYSDPGDEADHYEGSAPADASDGRFIFDRPEGFRHGFVKALAIDANNNTSPLAAKKPVTAPRTPSPIAATPTPSPTPGDTPEVTPTDPPFLMSVFLPLTGKGLENLGAPN